MTFTSTRKSAVFAFVLLLCLFVQCFFSAWQNGQTIDETFYNGSGYPIVSHLDYSFLGEHPPLIIELASLPLLFQNVNFPYKNPVRLDETGIDLSATGSKFLYKMGNNPYSILFSERAVIIFLTLCLGIIVYCWGSELYGPAGGLLPLLLYSFSPNIIAHGSNYTTDMGVTLFFTAAIFFGYRFFKRLNFLDSTLAGIFCGLAFVSKITAVLLFPIFLIFFMAVLTIYIREGRHTLLPNTKSAGFYLIPASAVLYFLSLPQNSVFSILGPLCLSGFGLAVLSRLKNPAKLKIVLLAAGLFIAWAICLNSAWHLKNNPVLKIGSAAWCITTFLVFLFMLITGQKRAEYPYAGFYFYLIHLSWISCLAGFFIVLAYFDFPQTVFKEGVFHHFIQSLQIAFNHAASDHQICMDGSFITCDWKYYFGVMAVKTPLISLVSIVAGSIHFFGSGRGKIEKFIFLSTILIFLFFASFINQIRIGLRHILPVYPFLFLLAGAVVPLIQSVKGQGLRRTLYFLLALSLLISLGRAALMGSNRIPYFNSLAGSIESGAHLTADSNVTWGEDNRRLADYLNAHQINAVKISTNTMNSDELEYHGISWSYMRPEELQAPQAGYYVFDVFGFIRQQTAQDSRFSKQVPKAKIGKSFYLYEIEEDPS